MLVEAKTIGETAGPQDTKLPADKAVSVKKRVLLIMSVSVLAAAVIFAAVTFVNDYYHATEKALRAMLGTAEVSVTETKDYYYFSRGGSAQDISGNTESEDEDAPGVDKCGIIFYPGGKVDERAYAPLLLRFAEAGYEVYLVRMPARLAVFGVDKAADIMNTATDVVEWTLIGHSLGGAMAADFAARHKDGVTNLVLLAAYSTKDLSETGIHVYSFYGSEDGVLNRTRYQSNFGNLPKDTVETVIDGGNHAYFAHYGEQKGDGTAAITREEQQETVLDVFLSCEKE